MEKLFLAGLEISILKKKIKNIHLGVYPPHGEVRLSAPEAFGMQEIRAHIISKIRWIRDKQASFLAQERESRREFIAYESHYFLGKRYQLQIEEDLSTPRVVLEHQHIKLYVRPHTTQARKKEILETWYRNELKKVALEYVKKWEPLLGVTVQEIGIKKMKTKWGSCNASENAGRIWLNLELAKKDLPSIEYIVLHEMVHFLEKNHTKRFFEILTSHLPDWSLLKRKLGAQPLGVGHSDS